MDSPNNRPPVANRNETLSRVEPGLFESVRKKVQLFQPNNTDTGRQFWMPDSRAKQCYDCGASFNALRRRHHCRICGQVFCHRCSQQMIDAKLYKACTGIETSGSVRVCRHCHRVTLRNDLPELVYDGSESAKSTVAQASKPNPSTSSTSSTINNWFLNSTIGRKLSSSASITSLGEMVRSTKNNSERKPSITRPVSATSNDQDRRYSVTNMPNYENAANYGLVSSSSFDNLRTLMTEVDDRIDESKPNWVKEILEETKKQLVHELDQEQKQMNEIEFAEDSSQHLNSRSIDYYSSDDDKDSDFNEVNSQDNSVQFSEIDSSRNIKLNYNSGDTVVRYSLSPTSTQENDRTKRKVSQLMSIDISNGHSLESSGSTETSPYDLFRHFMPGENSFFDEQFLLPKLENDKASQGDIANDSKTPATPLDTQYQANDELAFSLMEAIYDRHCNRILQQTLIDEKLSLDWLPILSDLSKRISISINMSHYSYLSSIDNYYMDNIELRQGLRRNTATTIRCGNTFYPMDVRQRLKIKTIQNGSKADCSIVNGIVFTKNVAHRKMRSLIENARILLFACSIGYDERKRSLATTTSTSAILKLTSFDSMLLQEHSYVSNLVGKIAAMKPDVIFVQGSVSSTALEMLHHANITVVLNVKRTILERISLFTKTPVIPSPEILSSTKVGQCGRFRLQEYVISKETDSVNGTRCPSTKKTLMFVEGCPESVGCSVILRGSSRLVEFRQLKSILGYLVYVQYNSRLEKAFHLGLNCLPIENATWKSMAEFYQQVNRTRQRINSARSHTSLIKNEDSVGSFNGCLNIDSSVDESKSSEKLSKAQLTTISDNSDPLRSALGDRTPNEVIDEDGTTSKYKLTTVQLTEIISTKFEQLLALLPLSSSPGIEFPVPFLMERNIHNKSSLRHYYPPNLIVSERLSILTSQEIDCIGGVSNERYQHNESLEKDDDYANYVFLSSHYSDVKCEYPSLTDAVNRKAEVKLGPLEKLLTMRYMVSKPHPMLTNCEYDHRKSSKQFVTDFRACGPYLRCMPDIVGRRTDQKSIQAANKIGPKSPVRNYLDDPFNWDRGQEPIFNMNEQSVEPLSSIDQERISVLFSVFSPQSKNAPNYCFKPRILDISYYGRNDMSLGAFLFRHFFFLRSRFNQPLQSNAIINESDIFASMNSTVSRKIFCSSETCNASMFRHLVRFSHHRGTITVLLNKIHDSRNVTMPHKILTWTFCVKCRQKSANAEMTPDALAFSFGKFLELKFYGNRHFNYSKYFIGQNNNLEPDSSRCDHSLHKDSYQFFSFDQLVVSFKFDPIVLNEVVPALPIIAITRNQFSKQDLIIYLQDLTMRGHEIYAKIDDEIEKIKEFVLNKGNLSSVSSLASLTVEPNDAGLMEEWKSQLQRDESDFVQAYKEAHIRISSPELETSSVVELFRIQNKVIRAKKSVIEIVTAWNDRINEFFASRKRNPDKLITSLMNRILPSDASKADTKSQDTMSNKSVDLDKNDETMLSTDLSASTDTLASSTMDSVSNENELIISSNSRVNDPNPSPVAKVPPSKFTTIISKVATKVGQVALTENGENVASSNTSFAARFLARTNEENYISIANPFESSAASKQYQMFEHYHLPTYKDMSIIVRDKDLGSIIAYALTTPEYDRKLVDMCQKSSHNRKVLSNESTSIDKEQVDGAMNSTAKTETNDAPTAKNVISDLNQQHIDVQYNDSFAKFYCCIYFAEQFRRLRSKVLTDGDGSNRDTVRRILPANIVNDPFAEDLYIHSLAICTPWNAFGGKSGSTFSKTQNQRFILKEISKGELNHFITFACDYIAYSERALLEKNPSSLVKIVGVYQISYKNTCTNKASIHHILVMENLFYECNISFIYDLKGSMRNRKVEIIPSPNLGQEEFQISENDPNQINNSEDSWRNIHDEAKLYLSNHNQTATVLMDENLRNINTFYPLYVHEHSKKLLMEAIFRDSEFLRNHGVMDYSLLVGFDEQFSEYVVGIIDYVRLFNWEKELEFRVKKLGKTIDPTIVHPSQYQRRFLDAINEYFIEVPDKWHPFLRLVPLAGTRIPSQTEDNIAADKNGKLTTDTTLTGMNMNHETTVDDNL